ncbi:MAG: RNA polymerase sigma factor [Planctomycetes bacterium]|jgi:RNA polymerase sigma-70 factor (ECF subfamily)|nr:RNA polymerase sigma factor [Planctomycetota bacterium]
MNQSDIESLVRAHQTGIWRYLRALGCSAAEAEDLTQETFLEVLRRPFEQRNEKSSAAYLRLVARHQMLMVRRKGGREVGLAEVEGIDAEWNEYAGDDGGGLKVEALKECLKGLDERERRALELRYKDEIPREEIGRALDLSDGGVKNLMERARDKLKRCMERRLKENQ